MKFVKTAGLCLVCMFAVSMAASAGASAAEARWEQCSEGPAEKPTKYTEHQCTVSRSTSEGKWQWNEIKGETEAVVSIGSLRLTDTKVPVVGKVVVECSGESIGDVGPNAFGRIQEVKTAKTQCRNIENCEKIEGIEARNTPWQTEIYETEGKVLGVLTGTTGSEPGWKVTCRVLGVTDEDECVTVAGEPETLSLENKASGGETPLLVLATFEHARKAKCSLKGEKSGEVTGSIPISKTNKWGLRVR